MDELEKIFNEKNISESSKKLYMNNLTRLNGGKPIKNLKFLNNCEDTLSKIEGYKPNTQRSYIISVVSLLKELAGQRKYKKLYDRYYEVLEKMNTELKDQTKKTDKEKQEWIGNDKVMEKLEECMAVIRQIEGQKKIIPEKYRELLACVITGLFVIQTPRRNKDYMEMVVTKKYSPDMSDDKNYLDLKTNTFILNQYKTKGTYNQQTADVEPLMREIIDVYLKYHPLKKDLKGSATIPFLVDEDGVPLQSNNAITRILYKVFDKKIGSSMLRKLYLTDKYKDVMDEMKDDATKMGTSVNTIRNNYIKND